MDRTEKYLEALEAAVADKDREAIALLEPFATYLYKEINSATEASAGEDRVAWERLLMRMKYIISGMVKLGPNLW